MAEENRIDLKCTAAGLAYVCIAAGALLMAFPGARNYLPKTSSDLASWVQAVGSIAAIVFAGIFATRQMKHTEELQRKVKIEDAAELVWACLHVARDAQAALKDLEGKLANQKKRPPSSCRERIEGLEETIRALLASKPHPMAVRELLIILTELAYSRVAIREWSDDEFRAYQAKTSIHRTIKVKFAADRLSTLYRAQKPVSRHIELPKRG